METITENVDETEDEFDVEVAREISEGPTTTLKMDRILEASKAVKSIAWREGERWSANLHPRSFISFEKTHLSCTNSVDDLQKRQWIRRLRNQLT